jgi:DNA repair photolyase
MKPIIEEIKVRSALTKTGIPGRKYCINPYVGCAHACKYCYATFMKRFTGHIEPWGSFVDIKINAHEVLRKQLKRTEEGNIIMSSVTDPYQPIEAKYMITRKCLEVLALYQFPVDILTKSPLILRDIDIISRLKDVEVGLTITTDDDKVRRIFEPNAPSISARIEALKQLHKAGIKTYVFIGPTLPMNPESLAKKIKPYVHRILIDKMNYESKVKWLYKKHQIEKWLDEEFIEEIVLRLKKSFSDKDVNVC